MVGYQCRELGAYSKRESRHDKEQKELQTPCIRTRIVIVSEPLPKLAYSFRHAIILCLLSAISGILIYRSVVLIMNYISENKHERCAEIGNNPVHIQQGK